MVQPIGVVLAGGAGRRLGGAGKADVALRGRPLAAWVAESLGSVVSEVVICARAQTVVPSVGVAVWREPEGGRPHPCGGVAFALARAGARGVLCCPVDLPFVSTAVLRALLDAPGAVVVAGGQPLLGRFGAGCAPALAAAARAGAPARAAVAALSPTVVEVDEASLVNVNTPADLAAAACCAGSG